MGLTHGVAITLALSWLAPVIPAGNSRSTQASIYMQHQRRDRMIDEEVCHKNAGGASGMFQILHPKLTSVNDYGLL